MNTDKNQSNIIVLNQGQFSFGVLAHSREGSSYNLKRFPKSNKKFTPGKMNAYIMSGKIKSNAKMKQINKIKEIIKKDVNSCYKGDNLVDSFKNNSIQTHTSNASASQLDPSASYCNNLMLYNKSVGHFESPKKKAKIKINLRQ